MKVHKVVTYVGEDGFTFFHEPIEDTISVKKVKDGYEASYLVQDHYAESPDAWEDDEVFLVNYHSDFYVDRPELVTKEEIKAFYRGEESELEDLSSYYHIFELSCLIHSGVVLKLHRSSFVGDAQGWDTSHVGAVLVSKKTARTEEVGEELAQALVETWNTFLSGDVYGVIREIYDKDKKPVDRDEFWSVYGYDYALEELKQFK